ncbi:GerAB/ArcD/ProY family transporter [Bacillus xiapuensis]|uniref:GerAB/ArcD/ProY family transporter n=1 Tax=Bacillus xiapuensis TaxID=2014075 RepID=UPI000C232FE8|nr:GerAB/ArcD/ProY family transporter [Bacillus xiapuensis]
MLPPPTEDRKVSPYFIFYIIVSMQIGMGILGFQRYIAKSAGHDAWISIIVAGLSLHFVMWMAYQILNKGNNDITVIHKELFGKWLGGLFSAALIIYLVILLMTVCRSYIEIIQIWIFPQLETWYMALILLVLIYIYVTSGFRVIVGLCFLTFLFTFPLFLMYGFPLKEAKFSYLLPVMDHSVSEILAGAKTMAFNYAGFETLFFLYPFIKNAPSSHKWAQYGVAYSTLTYMITAIVTFLYFSHGQLIHTIWATLTLWKIVDFPFIERFEYAGIALWLFVILPNLCLYTWGATRGMKQLFGIKQKKGLVLLLILTFIIMVLLTDRQTINQVTTWTGTISLYIFYAYIPFLFVFQKIRIRMRKSL